MLEKHSLTLKGHRTSITLEKEFWVQVKRLAARDGVTLTAWVEGIDAGRGEANLSSAIRVAVLRAVETRI